MKESSSSGGPLFETKAGKGRAGYRVLSCTILIGVVLIWIYRWRHVPRPGQAGRHAWVAIFFAELVFGLYWILTQSVRWNVVHRYPFKDRLSARYEEKLPTVDIFVCTADPTLEPPSLVINTVLSLMSYNYPPEKLSVYLSDDGGSDLTFYALLQASQFSKYWIPFCKKYNVKPRSPQVYFDQNANIDDSDFAREWNTLKKLYVDMKIRIDSIVKTGSIPTEIKDQHKGFLEWNSKTTKQDHQSIVQILIDGWNPNAVDIEGIRLPTLVYLSREKKSGSPHNFKAGSMNTLIRVSSKISNAPVILNLDCDMYSNDPNAIRDALCFFLDEKQGHQISYVQYPQRFNNITKNDIYANEASAIYDIELAGLDGLGGALYIGTGCFHRRESLSGMKYSGYHPIECTGVEDNIKRRNVDELENSAKILANCNYEKDTLWGKEMGLVYGYPVEDIVTGLTIQCRGWKPVFYNPKERAFLGVSPTTLMVCLVQYTRWAEGMFQIFCYRHCPFVYGRGKIKLGAQMGYCIYLLWAPISLPTICYVTVPALCLLHGVPLFPKIYSFWFVPFAYVFTASSICSIVEELMSGDSLKRWWNLQRMWVMRRTSCYFFALIDTIKKQLGLSETSFVLTDKVVDDQVQKRYDEEIMEFGNSSIMFTVIATLGLLNLFSGLGWGIKRLVWFETGQLDMFVAQLVICGLMIVVNIPVFEALLFRSDQGRLPYSVLFKSIAIASLACLIPIYY